MTTLAEVISAVQEWFDPRWAESWDAVGLTCGDPAAEVNRVVLAVDVTPQVVAEAQAAGAGLLLTHHPLLLTAVHGVPATDPKGGLVHRMIRAGIAHYVAHTNADVADPGVSDALATRLGLTGLRPLDVEFQVGAGGVQGTGRVGELPESMTLRQFAEHAARVLPATAWGLRAAGDPDREVRTVAVCGGSGAAFIEAACRAGADVYLTADLKHHATLEAVTERGMALVDAAHWATEAPWLDVVAGRLRQRFGTTVNVTVSATVTDPWTLHVPSPEASSQS